MPRVVVIGAAGNAGRRHSETFQAAEWDVQTAGHGDSWQTLVQNPATDVVSICTPDNLHAAMAILALEAGKHVICEKPLTHRADELDAIEECARRHDEQTFSTNFPLRHHPHVAEFTNILRKNDRPYFLDGVYNYGRLSKMRHGWRGEMPDYSIFCGGGIHLADIMLAGTSGDIDPLKWCSVAPKDSWDRLAVAEYIQDGTLCRITCNFGYEGKHFVSVEAFWSSGVDGFAIYDDDGYDKSADIKTFILAVENDLPGNGADAIRANRLCLDLEAAGD